MYVLHCTTVKRSRERELAPFPFQNTAHIVKEATVGELGVVLEDRELLS